jgi:hypothetical protein
MELHSVIKKNERLSFAGVGLVEETKGGGKEGKKVNNEI